MDIAEAARNFFAALGTREAEALVRPDAVWEEPPQRLEPAAGLARWAGWTFAVEDVLVKRNVAFAQVAAEGPGGLRRGIAILAWAQDERLAQVTLDLSLIHI